MTLVLHHRELLPYQHKPHCACVHVAGLHPTHSLQHSQQSTSFPKLVFVAFRSFYKLAPLPKCQDRQSSSTHTKLYVSTFDSYLDNESSIPAEVSPREDQHPPKFNICRSTSRNRILPGHPNRPCAKEERPLQRQYPALICHQFRLQQVSGE